MITSGIVNNDLEAGTVTLFPIASEYKPSPTEKQVNSKKFNNLYQEYKKNWSRENKKLKENNPALPGSYTQTPTDSKAGFLANLINSPDPPPEKPIGGRPGSGMGSLFFDQMADEESSLGTLNYP